MVADASTETHRFHLPELYPKQRKVFYCPENISVCFASTKSGKSAGCLVWMAGMAMTQWRGMSALYTSYIYKQARVMFRRMFRLLRAADPQRKSGWSINRSELIIIMPGGCQIHFMGAESYDAIYGSDYAGAVIDEASRCKEEVLDAVLSTLTATGGPLRIIGNMKGRKNWVYRLAQKAMTGAPGVAYHKLTADDAVDAGILRRDVIDARRSVMSEAAFRELYYAEPSDDGGNPFGLQHIAACWSDTTLRGEAVAYGFDLAKSQDWTVCIGLSAKGEAVSVDRWNQIPWSETKWRLKRIIGDKPAYGDSTGVGDPILEDLQRECRKIEGFKFTLQSKQQLMEGLSAAIQGHEVKFNEPMIRAELEAFEYQVERTHTLYAAPEGMHDDCVVALALAVKAWGAHRMLPDSYLSVVVAGMEGGEKKATGWDWDTPSERFGGAYEDRAGIFRAV